jgi:hypothetical protein
MGGAGARGYKIGATWACGLPAAYFLEDVLFDFAPYKEFHSKTRSWHSRVAGTE